MLVLKINLNTRTLLVSWFVGYKVRILSVMSVHDRCTEELQILAASKDN